MNPQNLQQLLKVMDEMVDLEMTLASLYETCAAEFPEDLHFWNAIRQQEQRHAESITRMAALVAAKPQDYTMGRSFNSAAIRTIKNGILEHIANLKQHKITRARIMTIARDIENSVLEANYRELVKTENLEFLDVVGRINTETVSHKNLLVKKIASIEVRKTS